MPREMKDSGIEWIGEIPSHWSVSRLKDIFTNSVAGEVIDKGYWNDGTELLYTCQKTPMKSDYPNFPERKRVGRNDLLLTRNATPYIFIPVVGSIYSNVVQKITLSDNADRRFVRYVLKQGADAVVVNGDTIPSYNMGVWSNIKITLPPLAEQKAVADFLDKKCAEIDAVIEQTKATIEEYKKLKQSVITEAVTKGIRGNRLMKDSGIEWIGEIPREWKMVKITRLLDYSVPYPIGDGDHGLISPSDYTDSGIPYLRVQNLGFGTPINHEGLVYITSETNEKIKGSTLKPNDVLFAKTGATIGKTGIIPLTMPIANTTSHIGKITVSPLYNPMWVLYVLSSTVGYRQFWEIALQKTTRPELSILETKAIKITVPSNRNEQDEIVAYLDQKCAEIDTLIEKKTALLAEMENYKKSLIFEYVTGKKEVASATEEVVAVVYPYFPSVLPTSKPRFAQAVLMSKILDSNVSNMGRVKLEKMLFTIEHSLGFDFDTEYHREAAGPLDSSIYECERVVSQRNKWFYVNSSDYGVSYKARKDMSKYKKYYEQYFSDYNEEIERIITIFRNYSFDQAEIVATLYGAWNDFVIDKKEFTDEDVVDDVLNNWNDSKKRFSKDVWLRAMQTMKNNNLVPKGYGKRTVGKEDV